MAEEVADTSMEETGEEGDQEVVTLGEVLQNEQEMMDDANAVLGALDDKKCTYAEGYMKRQALYSCLTCIPEARTDLAKAAGVCLACCYYCHEGHELIELYTKRNFRCDCGNSKFSNQTCNLEASKSDINELNEYNQNFAGLYCTCKRPYPDPEDTAEDEMIQCIICEDWYHTRHLGETPLLGAYAEMTCEACVKQHEFLLHYDGLAVPKVASAEQSEVKIEQEPKPVDVCEPSEGNSNEPSEGSSKEPMEGGSNEPSEVSTDTNSCKMPTIKSEKVTSKFWFDVEWRKQLCTCMDCLKKYDDEKVMFLIDPQDTVQVYEEKGKAKAREFEEKRHEDDMKFLNSLDRVPLMEALAGFNDLKTNLMEYLKKFAQNKKVVREEDIREFFSKYDVKKRQKCEVPHYCR